MPYRIEKLGTGFVVVNKETGRRHSKKPITEKNAKSQMRLLTAIEKGGFRPTGK